MNVLDEHYSFDGAAPLGSINRHLIRMVMDISSWLRLYFETWNFLRLLFME